jgi:hypothetical protein
MGTILNILPKNIILGAPKNFNNMLPGTNISNVSAGGSGIAVGDPEPDPVGISLTGPTNNNTGGGNTNNPPVTGGGGGYGGGGSFDPGMFTQEGQPEEKSQLPVEEGQPAPKKKTGTYILMGLAAVAIIYFATKKKGVVKMKSII